MAQDKAVGNEGLVVVDTHAHVFTSTLPLVAGRRYAPEGEHPVEDYLQVLDRHGVTHGVLVQPSFLGNDNGYVLDCLARYPERLRGVAVVAPETPASRLADLDRAGIVGVRLNLIGAMEPWGLDAAMRRLAENAAALDWHVEIQAQGKRLAAVLHHLAPTGAKLVVDHFGRPGEAGSDDPGFRAVLDVARRTHRLWVKLSGPYRCGFGDTRALAGRLLAEPGPDRLLWGSDWPWTQHAEGKSYEMTRRWLEEWVPDRDTRARILGASAAKLFRLPTTP